MDYRTAYSVLEESLENCGQFEQISWDTGSAVNCTVDPNKSQVPIKPMLFSNFKVFALFGSVRYFSENL